MRRLTSGALVCMVVGLNLAGQVIADTPEPAAKPVGPVVKVSQVDYKGWRNCYRMSAGTTSLVVVPQIGGRIMEYSLNGANVIFENKAEAGKVYPITNVWHNYGGFKNWQAPQVKWGWPPDPYLDFGAATVEILKPDDPSPTLQVTGAASISSGLMFQREINMDPTTGDVTVKQRMYNVAGKDQEWSVWDITQVSVPCLVALPMNPHSAFRNGWEPLTDGKNDEGTQWSATSDLVIVQPKAIAGKIGMDVSAGWMAYFRGRLAYIKRIPDFSTDAVYPDNGANAEIWVNGKELPYLEMEILSPIFKLSPGAYGELTETWQLRLLQKPVKTQGDVHDAVKELGLVSSP